VIVVDYLKHSTTAQVYTLDIAALWNVCFHFFWIV